MKKLKEVLLIDDSMSTNNLNRRLLTEMGAAEVINIANDGESALAFLSTKNEKGITPSPDIIFLDIKMPIMNGYEFLDAYKEFESKKKLKRHIIMLTSSIRDIDINRAIKSKVVISYLSKPLTIKKMHQIINQIN